MEKLTLAVGVILTIPKCWDCFVYQRVLFRRDTNGHFVPERSWP